MYPSKEDIHAKIFSFIKIYLQMDGNSFHVETLNKNAKHHQFKKKN